MFDELESYADYLKLHPFHEELGIDLDKYGTLDGKQKKRLNLSPQSEPYAAELDDLVRLHYLVVMRKVTTIMEFGVGKSTVAFDHALGVNKQKYATFAETYLRRSNAFECHSIDDSEQWISECQNKYNTRNVSFHYSPTSMSTFNSRICTFYDDLPNICPDFIYLDAPCYYSPIGNVRGISTNHPDRMPMAADILSIEHFLLPGTMIVVDGRTANARFLKLNFQRNWSYSYIEKYDQHFFELLEQPLGKFNEQQIDFSLGETFYQRCK